MNRRIISIIIILFMFISSFSTVIGQGNGCTEVQEFISTSEQNLDKELTKADLQLFLAKAKQFYGRCGVDADEKKIALLSIIAVAKSNVKQTELSFEYLQFLKQMQEEFNDGIEFQDFLTNYEKELTERRKATGLKFFPINLHNYIRSKQNEIFLKFNEAKEIELSNLLPSVEIVKDELKKELDLEQRLNGLRTAIDMEKQKLELFLDETMFSDQDLRDQGLSREKIKEKIMTLEKILSEAESNLKIFDIKDYDVFLGKGVQGVVYEGLVEGKHAAVKSSQSVDDLLKEIAAYEMLPETLKKYFPEFYGFTFVKDEAGIKPGMSIEYISGESYSDLSTTEQVKFLSKLSDVVRALHKEGVAHGDLHTENMKSVNGEVLLLDPGFMEFKEIDDYSESMINDYTLQRLGGAIKGLIDSFLQPFEQIMIEGTEEEKNTAVEAFLNILQNFQEDMIENEDIELTKIQAKTIDNVIKSLPESKDRQKIIKIAEWLKMPSSERQKLDLEKELELIESIKEVESFEKETAKVKDSLDAGTVEIKYYENNVVDVISDNGEVVAKIKLSDKHSLDEDEFFDFATNLLKYIDRISKKLLNTKTFQEITNLDYELDQIREEVEEVADVKKIEVEQDPVKAAEEILNQKDEEAVKLLQDQFKVSQTRGREVVRELLKQVKSLESQEKVYPLIQKVIQETDKTVFDQDEMNFEELTDFLQDRTAREEFKGKNLEELLASEEFEQMLKEFANIVESFPGVALAVPFIDEGIFYMQAFDENGARIFMIIERTNKPAYKRTFSIENNKKILNAREMFVEDSFIGNGFWGYLTPLLDSFTRQLDMRLKVPESLNNKAWLNTIYEFDEEKVNEDDFQSKTRTFYSILTSEIRTVMGNLDIEDQRQVRRKIDSFFKNSDGTYKSKKDFFSREFNNFMASSPKSNSNDYFAQILIKKQLENIFGKFGVPTVETPLKAKEQLSFEELKAMMILGLLKPFSNKKYDKLSDDEKKQMEILKEELININKEIEQKKIEISDNLLSKISHYIQKIEYALNPSIPKKILSEQSKEQSNLVEEIKKESYDEEIKLYISQRNKEIDNYASLKDFQDDIKLKFSKKYPDYELVFFENLGLIKDFKKSDLSKSIDNLGNLPGACPI